MSATKSGTYAPNTIRNWWISLKAFSRWCVSRKYQTESALLNIPRPKVEKKLPTFLDEATIRQLLIFVAGRKKKHYRLAYLRDKCFVSMLVYTGLRRSEMLSLKMSDVDTEKGFIRLSKTKSNMEQRQPIPNSLKPVLEDYMRYRGHFKRESDAFFIAVNRSGKDKKRGDGSFGSRGVQLLFDEINANVKASHKITPHLLRRSFATTMIKKTGNIFIVSKLLRHASISTTVNSYAGVDAGELTSAVNRLSF